MAPPSPNKRPRAPTTAVVQVAQDGTATLYLGTDLVEHAVRVDAAAVMRVLVDYAASIDTGMRVTTQMPNGTWTRHLIDPGGAVTEIPPGAPHVQPCPPRTSGATRQASAPPNRLRMKSRIMSRAPFIAALLLVTAMLMATAISGMWR